MTNYKVRGRPRKSGANNTNLALDCSEIFLTRPRDSLKGEFAPPCLTEALAKAGSDRGESGCTAVELSKFLFC